MLELLIFSLYGLTTLVFTRYFNGRLIRFVPFLYLLLFIIANIIFHAFGDGLLMGKPDQYKYLAYGTRHEYSTWSDATIMMSPNYWYMSAVAHTLSMFPIEILRLINIGGHLIGIIYAHKTVLLLTGDEKRALVASYIIAVSPTLLVFDMYILRDAVMLYLFMIAFYLIARMYREQKLTIRLSLFISLCVFVAIEYFFREQLALIIMMMGVIILFRRFIASSIVVFLASGYAIMYGIMVVLQHAGGQAAQMFRVVQSVLEPQYLGIYAWKFLLYSTGLSFLDPYTRKSEALAILLVQRGLAFDAFIFMFGFMMMLLLNKFSALKKLLNTVLAAYILYSIIYFYYGEAYEKLSLHFRALLPFFYTSIIFVVSSWKYRAKEADDPSPPTLNVTKS